MKTPAFTLCLLAAVSSPAWAGLEAERELLKQDPAKVATQLQQQLAQKPSDPWLLYNVAVASYAAKDFAKADETWQQLAATQMPDSLREHVWFQIGNASYRMVQPQIEKEPDLALTRLEQSREAFRVSLAFNKKNKQTADNLRFVETELEKVYARLAKRLADEAKKENWVPRAVEKLEAALTYAQQAQSLNPKDQQRQQEKQDIEKALAQRLDQRAAQEEKVADQRNPENAWDRKDAQERLQNALSDFQQAQGLDKADQTARDGEKRVSDKLANLFDKAGRKDQEQARQMTQNRPEQAVDKFEQALENFQEALSIQPEHADAQAGEKEVREELEALHLDQGDRQAQRGEQLAQRNPEQAAENLLNALQNFESAQALDPQNPEIQPRIDKVEGMLPELLTKVAQKEQQQGEKAEGQGQVENAVANYEQAENNFAQAQGMQPGNEAAKQGQQQVQEALARLRQQLAQNAEQQSQKGQQQQKSQQPSEAKETFQSMLSKVKEDLRDREVNARHHQGQKYNEERDRNLRNW
jgi:tetratricopeptide (TPR) repeat protein